MISKNHRVFKLQIATIFYCVLSTTQITTSLANRMDLEDICPDTTSTVYQVPENIEKYMKKVSPFPPDRDAIDTTTALNFITDIQEIGNNTYEGTLNYFEVGIDLTFEYIGTLDSRKRFHGQSQMKIEPNQQCIRGVCSTHAYQSIHGTFIHGVLNGSTVLTSDNGNLVTYLPIKEGVVHGIVLTYGLKNLYPLPVRPDKSQSRFYSKRNEIGQLVRFRNGRMDSDYPSWQRLFGTRRSVQGFLYGKVGSNGKMSGDAIRVCISPADFRPHGEWGSPVTEIFSPGIPREK